MLESCRPRISIWSKCKNYKKDYREIADSWDLDLMWASVWKKMII
jgi:hypothetical protein